MRRLATLFVEIVTLDESECMDYAARLLKRTGDYTIARAKNDDFLIATPRHPAPIGLVAHCDTVRPGKPPTANQLVNQSGTISVRGGGILGADDRAGVAAILRLVELGKRPQIYLTTGEESHGIGATALADSDYLPPDTLNLLIQIDRQGGIDFVTYDCESKPLDKYITSAGYRKANGSFSDISILAPAWGIAAANVAAGYYDQHRQTELVAIPQLWHTVERITAMLTTPPKRLIAYEERPKPQYKSANRYSAGDWSSTDDAYSYGGAYRVPQYGADYPYGYAFPCNGVPPADALPWKSVTDFGSWLHWADYNRARYGFQPDHSKVTCPTLLAEYAEAQTRLTAAAAPTAAAGSPTATAASAEGSFDILDPTPRRHAASVVSGGLIACRRSNGGCGNLVTDSDYDFASDICLNCAIASAGRWAD